MRATLLTAFALLAFLPLLPALGEDAAPDFPKLVKDLGDPSFQVREAASDALAKAGEGARATLAEAARSTDPEVQSRARGLLETLDAKRAAAARKARGEDEEPTDPVLQLQRALMQAVPPQVFPVPAGQGGAIRIAVNLNGKMVQLDQNDLAKLEALKGRKMESVGITCGACPEALADQLRIPGGVLVQDAEAKPAGLDLEKHDVIVEAAGAAVTSAEALDKLLLEAAGKPLALTLYRKGEKKTVTITPPKP